MSTFLFVLALLSADRAHAAECAAFRTQLATVLERARHELARASHPPDTPHIQQIAHWIEAVDRVQIPELDEHSIRIPLLRWASIFAAHALIPTGGLFHAIGMQYHFEELFIPGLVRDDIELVTSAEEYSRFLPAQGGQYESRSWFRRAYMTLKMHHPDWVHLFPAMRSEEAFYATFRSRVRFFQDGIHARDAGFLADFSLFSYPLNPMLSWELSWPSVAIQESLKIGGTAWVISEAGDRLSLPPRGLVHRLSSQNMINSLEFRTPGWANSAYVDHFPANIFLWERTE